MAEVVAVVAAAVALAAQAEEALVRRRSHLVLGEECRKTCRRHLGTTPTQQKGVPVLGSYDGTPKNTAKAPRSPGDGLVIAHCDDEVCSVPQASSISGDVLTVRQLASSTSVEGINCNPRT